nr:hypothetical protein [Tanacetum cinerariifolium]
YHHQSQSLSSSTPIRPPPPLPSTATISTHHLSPLLQATNTNHCRKLLTPLNTTTTTTTINHRRRWLGMVLMAAMS